MLTVYLTLIGFCSIALAFVLWYDYWYTPRHKKKHPTN